MPALGSWQVPFLGPWPCGPHTLQECYCSCITAVAWADSGFPQDPGGPSTRHLPPEVGSPGVPLPRSLQEESMHSLSAPDFHLADGSVQQELENLKGSL